MKRKCSWCDFVGTTFQLKKHLTSEHGKSVKDYILKLNGFEEVPKCPYCGEERSVPESKFIVRATCGKKSCSMKYASDIGTNPFNSENRIYDEYGRDIISYRGSMAQLKNGTHPFQKDNIHSKSAHSQNMVKNRITILYLISFREVDRCKVGRTRNLPFRIQTFKDGGLNPKVIKAIEMSEIEANDLEREIKYEFSSSKHPLDLTEFPNKGYFRLGHSEFYDINILDDLSSYIGD